MKPYRWLQAAAPMALALLQPVGAHAQDAPALPDPATIKVPDVTPSKDPKVHENGYKFYYFHNPSVTFAEAYQDLKECRAYLPIGGGTVVPGFIPWDEAHGRAVVQGTPMFVGILPAIMASILVPKEERGVRSNKMRRCMGTRGYDRYAIPEAAFDMLNDGDEEQLVLMQAKLASGPKPQDEVVTK